MSLTAVKISFVAKVEANFVKKYIELVYTSVKHESNMIYVGLLCMLGVHGYVTTTSQYSSQIVNT